MIVQLEDYIECFAVTCNDEYDFVFLFDHSSGHAKKRPNGLDASTMNKGHNGILQDPSPIKQYMRYLIEFHNP